MDRKLEVSSLGSIFRGASIFTIGKLVYNFLKFALNFVLTRGLGAELYGVYSFAYTAVGAIITVLTLGSEKAVLRFYPSFDQSQGKQGVLTFSLGVSFFMSLTAAISLWAFAPLITKNTLNNAELTPTLRIFAGLLIGQTLLKILSSTFRALDLPEYDTLIGQIAQPLVGLIAVSIVLQLGYELHGTVAAIMLSSLGVSVIGLILLIKKTDINIISYVSRSEVGEYARFSLPLTLKDAGSFLYNRADILMVGYFLGSSIVGIYNISVLLATVVVLPLSALNRIFPSVASNLHDTGKQIELESVFRTVTRWSLTASLPIAIFGIILGDEILAIFGPDFTSGEYVLAFFLAGQLLNAAVGPSGYFLLMTDHQYLVSFNQWIFGLINIVMNYYFITEFGMVGAAAATAAVLGVLNLVRLGEVWYYNKMIPYSRKLIKPFVATAVSGCLVLLLQDMISGTILVIGGGIFGILVYATLLIIMGIESGDIEFVQEYIK